jgi:hypothetical protein
MARMAAAVVSVMVARYAVRNGRGAPGVAAPSGPAVTEVRPSASDPSPSSSRSSTVDAPPALQLGPGRYCSPRHPRHFEPSLLELNGILRRYDVASNICLSYGTLRGYDVANNI